MNDPRRKTAPFIGLGVGALVIGVIAAFALSGPPQRTEPVPVAADPNPSSINTQTRERPFEVDAGQVPLLDSGTVDPELVQAAMAAAADAGVQTPADGG